MTNATSADITIMKSFLIIDCILLAFALIIYITIITLLWRRRKIQPLRKKSPLLILLSVIGNSLLSTYLFYSLIVVNACKIFGNPHGICDNSHFIKFNCSIGFLLLSIGESLAVLPYIMRAVRLNSVLKA